MSWKHALVFAAWLLAACQSATRGPSRLDAVPVLHVTDGDTIHVVHGGTDEAVRLIGVDTPEVPWYGGPGECFGVEAGRFTRDRLTGRPVRLEFDVERRDRYGRLLAYVYVGDELFNLTLVRDGYATSYPVSPNTKMAARFESAETEARATGMGLWAACGDR
ncbi:MAG: thermonuclease family protein [Actinomycetota bacterium]